MFLQQKKSPSNSAYVVKLSLNLLCWLISCFSQKTLSCQKNLNLKYDILPFIFVYILQFSLH